MDRNKTSNDLLDIINKKYSDLAKNELSKDLLLQIQLLSEEFVTLGLEELNTESIPSLLNSFVNNSFHAIHLHRKLLTQISDININQRASSTTTSELQKEMMQLETMLDEANNQNKNHSLKVSQLTNEISELNEKIVDLKKDKSSLRHHFKSKENQLQHQIKQLEKENDDLKAMCLKRIGGGLSKETFFEQIQTFKQNEALYKEAIKKLEDNNAEIMNEILNLRNDLALVYLNKND